MFENVRADIALKQEWFLKGESWLVRHVRVWIEPGTIAVLVYRYGSWVRRLKLPLIRHLLLIPYGVAKLLVVLFLQVVISSRVPIGKGLVIHNLFGAFLMPERIGENCIVFQGVLVGHVRHVGGRRPAPSIGDNVFLGAGCKVLGNVRIGNNVVVGANSLVIASVPDNCTVLGVPARIVSRDTRWIREKLGRFASAETPSVQPDKRP